MQSRPQAAQCGTVSRTGPAASAERCALEILAHSSARVLPKMVYGGKKLLAWDSFFPSSFPWVSSKSQAVYTRLLIILIDILQATLSPR